MHVRADRARERRVDDRRMRVVIEVDRYQLLIGIVEDSFEPAVRGVAEDLVDLLGAGALVGLERQVDQGNVRSRTPRRCLRTFLSATAARARRPARRLWSWDHRERRGPRAAEVLVREVEMT